MVSPQREEGFANKQKPDRVQKPGAACDRQGGLPPARSPAPQLPRGGRPMRLNPVDPAARARLQGGRQQQVHRGSGRGSPAGPGGPGCRDPRRPAGRALGLQHPGRPTCPSARPGPRPPLRPSSAGPAGRRRGRCRVQVRACLGAARIAEGPARRRPCPRPCSPGRPALTWRARPRGPRPEGGAGMAAALETARRGDAAAREGAEAGAGRAGPSPGPPPARGVPPLLSSPRPRPPHPNTPPFPPLLGHSMYTQPCPLFPLPLQCHLSLPASFLSPAPPATLCPPLNPPTSCSAFPPSTLLHPSFHLHPCPLSPLFATPSPGLIPMPLTHSLLSPAPTSTWVHPCLISSLPCAVSASPPKPTPSSLLLPSPPTPTL